MNYEEIKTEILDKSEMMFTHNGTSVNVIKTPIALEIIKRLIAEKVQE